MFLRDSGYPLQPWLMTPVAEPAIRPGEAAFNKAHKTNRSIIERAIGSMKQRFPSLQKFHTLRYWPDRATFIITTCAILQNLCIEYNVPMPENEDYFSANDDHEPEPYQWNVTLDNKQKQLGMKLFLITLHNLFYVSFTL